MPQLSFSNLNNTRVAPNSTTRTTRTTRTPSFLYALWSFHVPIHPLCDVPFESCGKERNVENVENVKKIHQWLLDVEGPVQLDANGSWYRILFFLFILSRSGAAAQKDLAVPVVPTPLAFQA